MTSTSAAVLHLNGTAALIRITPDTETIAAVLGGWAYGFSPASAAVTFWGLMPQFIIAFAEPHGDGEPNALAGDVHRALVGGEHTFSGQILVVNDEGTAALDEAVYEFAEQITDLRDHVKVA